MTALVLTEKRSQADAIAAAFALSKRGQSYQGSIFGNEVEVCWAAGHLLEQLDVTASMPEATWNDINTLMPIPANILMAAKEDRKDHLQRLIHAIGTTDHVIIGTDPDREGEAIGREILDEAKFSGRVSRLWLVSGMDPSSIQGAFRKLRPSEQTLGLYRAQQCRAGADWQSQLLTRAMTIRARSGLMGNNLGKGKGREGVVSVGRVQTATLALVVQRDRLIESFDKRNHYVPILTVQQGEQTADLKYRPIFTADTPRVINEQTVWLGEGTKERVLFIDELQASAFCDSLLQINPYTLRVKLEIKNVASPMCHSLPSLQKEMDKSAGLSPQETQDAAAKLYQAGYISYPRTQHQELPPSNYEHAPALLGSLRDEFSKAAGAALEHIEHGKAKMPRCYSDKEAEHNGLQPTTKFPNSNNLGREEKLVYQEIVRRYIEAHLPPATYEHMKVVAGTSQLTGLLGENPIRFGADTKQLIDAGWQGYFRKPSKGGIPAFVDGPCQATASRLDAQTTKPPARYTSATLIDAMEHAGRFAEGTDAKMLKSVEGIGTADTRAKIIEVLHERAYMGKQKKALISTDKGRDLIDHAPGALSSVEMTAGWESIMAEVEQADDTVACNMRDEFLAQCRQVNTQIMTGLADGVIPRKEGHPSQKAIEFARRLAEQLNVELPPDAATDAKVCSEFIDANADKRDLSPSPNALAFAQKLAEQAGKKVPAKVAKDYRECKAFIEKLKAKRPPSPAMLKAAQLMAGKKQVKLPKNCETSFDRCMAFLDKHGDRQRA